VTLENRGNVEALVPETVRIAGACGQSDGINGFHVEERTAAGVRFVSEGMSLLRVGQARTIGWLRCADQPRRE
jgi:hypothetical protein